MGKRLQLRGCCRYFEKGIYVSSNFDCSLCCKSCWMWRPRLGIYLCLHIEIRRLRASPLSKGHDSPSYEEGALLPREIYQGYVARLLDDRLRMESSINREVGADNVPTYSKSVMDQCRLLRPDGPVWMDASTYSDFSIMDVTNRQKCDCSVSPEGNTMLPWYADQEISAGFDVQP